MLLATFGEWAFVIGLGLGALILLFFVIGSEQDAKRNKDENGSRPNGNSANQGEES